MKIYLAGPFFNPDQVAAIERIESLLSKFSSLEVYSPRKDGVLMNMTPEERAAATHRIFRLNCDHILTSQVILAVMDGRDQGTIWEIGYAYGIRLLKENKIVTFSDEGHGINVMLKGCIDAHCHGMRDLEEVATIVSSRSWLSLKRFRNFDPQKVY